VEHPESIRKGISRRPATPGRSSRAVPPTTARQSAA
jgi:hypothetical protein